MSEQHHPHLIDFNCYLITDRHATRGRPLVAAVEAAAHAGISAVQLREKDLNPRQLYALAEELRDVLKVTGTRLLINDRADIVAAAGLDGVHLTSNSITPAQRENACRKIPSSPSRHTAWQRHERQNFSVLTSSPLVRYFPPLLKPLMVNQLE